MTTTTARDFGDMATTCGEIVMCARWAKLHLDDAYKSRFPSGGHWARAALVQLRQLRDALPELIDEVEREIGQ